LLANLGVITALIGGLLYVVSSGAKPGTKTEAVVAAQQPPPPARPAAPASASKPDPKPRPVLKAPEIDRAAIAKANAALEQAKREHVRAERRAADAARRLSGAPAAAASAASASRSLALRLRDPSAHIARTKARGAFLQAEHDRLKGEIIAISRAPRPKAKSLVDKTPVARPAGNEEFHFEVRRNRVAFVDLQRLLNLVKADAQVRVRMSDNARVVESKVGPVGAFSLEYVLARALPSGVEELLERHGLSYDLRGWEIVPEFEGRGETYETARQPISAFSQAINRLGSESATITMWVYPDGFELFRKLRDDLHGRGFLVAARPLPEGMGIRGSPSGSVSAGQ
jgi:hypothetical protein